MNKSKVVIIAIAPVGEGISGSDRIFIEFARNLALLNNRVEIITWVAGKKMCERNYLSNNNIKFTIIPVSRHIQSNFLVCYIARIILGVIWSLKVEIYEATTIYSSSDFWMDVFPSVILKLRKNKSIFWVASWYQTAPNPFKGFSEGKRQKRYRLNAFAYWFMQLPIKPLINKFANQVLVNNETEKQEFPVLTTKNKVKVVFGAVDTEKINHWQVKHQRTKKEYDAVFQGRFHPQKGVIELIYIWRKVVNHIPNAKLMMIGDGPLMTDVKRKIKEQRLEKNVVLLGYLFDGDKKYTVFSKSKLVVHPALYDSGGMAAAEAMIFGIPAVGFNLKSYESYYPNGMVKVPIGDLEKFAQKIVQLLMDDNMRKKIGDEASNMIQSNWSWKSRTREIWSALLD